MVSPNLATKKIDSGSEELNVNAKKLFQATFNDINRKQLRDDGSPRIQVSELISKMAFFYEKIRNAVDYDEDHLLRKNAIARILKRQVRIEGLLKTTRTGELAKHLLSELIRGGYLPNNSLPESKIKEVASILDKYLKLKDRVVQHEESSSEFKSKNKKSRDLAQDKSSLVVFLLNLAACEIEEGLVFNQTKQAMVNVMFDTLNQGINLPADLPYARDLQIQIYLSISRNYSRYDEDMITFVLFKYYNNGWSGESFESISSSKDEQINQIALTIRDLRGAIEYQLKHPLKKQLDKVVQRYALYFTVLQETIASDPAKIYNEFKYNPKTFYSAITKVCNQKYLKAKSRLWRAAFRSIIYIFLTKSIFVFMIEIPAIHLFNQPLNYVSLAINISFPAILLFFIVALTRVPGKNNTDKIIEGVREIAIEGAGRDNPIKLRNPQKRGIILNSIFNFIYFTTFLFSIYFIVWLLTKVNFNWVSIVIFLFFLAFVSFFSIIVTKGVKELLIVEKKENIFSFLLDLFYMPIIIAGKWLSSNMSKINIFIFIFDFIIEAPFKILVDVAEDWTKYLKERKDNMT